MKAKLLLDEDVHFGLASTLRKRRYDVVHTQDLALSGPCPQTFVFSLRPPSSVLRLPSHTIRDTRLIRSQPSLRIRFSARDSYKLVRAPAPLIDTALSWL